MSNSAQTKTCEPQVLPAAVIVVAQPENALAYTNKVYLNPAARWGSSSCGRSEFVSVEGVLFAYDFHEGVKLGAIAMNALQRFTCRKEVGELTGVNFEIGRVHKLDSVTVKVEQAMFAPDAARLPHRVVFELKDIVETLHTQFDGQVLNRNQFVWVKMVNLSFRCCVKGLKSRGCALYCTDGRLTHETNINVELEYPLVFSKNPGGDHKGFSEEDFKKPAKVQAAAQETAVKAVVADVKSEPIPTTTTTPATGASTSAGALAIAPPRSPTVYLGDMIKTAKAFPSCHVRPEDMGSVIRLLDELCLDLMTIRHCTEVALRYEKNQK